MKTLLVVGAGFSGAVLAREFAEAGYKVDVVDARGHVAGNCHTEEDSETGIMLHKYGPHIFHTNSEDVWSYVNRFAKFYPFINRVKSVCNNSVFSLPINLHTINQFFSKSMSPSEAQEFIRKISVSSINVPQNFEEQALKFVGTDLYEAFFKGYTIKQWGVDPRNLPASILKRLPIRFNYNDSYYDSRYQGMPRDGYTALVSNILSHENVSLSLNTKFSASEAYNFDHVFFTGPLDEYFAYRFGRLGYRTVYWERQVFNGDFQGNAVINYPGLDVPFTRVHEHKHFAPWEEKRASVVMTEFSKETEVDDIPYYPKRLAADLDVLRQYVELAESEKNVSFVGRLATYRYVDMHQVIGEALAYARLWLQAQATGQSISSFSASPLPS